ncbi:hypothetical protein EON65_07860 [archaeon]|nr:MAG: hypothetical protein EON65_07860 [archaeon]
MAYCIQVTKEYVDKQVTWLATAETECLSLLQAINHDRYLRELTAGEKVIDLIESCIANAEPLDMLWLVTPDASTPVQPASFWKKWRFLVPFVWLKQYEKAQKEKKTKAELAQMALKGLSRGKGTRTTPTIGEDEPLEDDELASEGHGSFIGGSLDAGSEGAASGESDPQVAASRMRRAMGGSRSTGRLSDATSSGQRHTSLRRPSTTGSSGKKAQSPSVGGRRIGSAPRRRGSSEAHLQRLRSPSINTTSRPGSGGEDQVAKEQERYLHQKQLLEEKLQKIRELRELDFRSLGMSPSAAKLAAFNELLLEEQHQLADLEAQWKPALARSRATVRGTIAKRPTMHGGGH